MAAERVRVTFFRSMNACRFPVIQKVTLAHLYVGLGTNGNQWFLEVNIKGGYEDGRECEGER